MIHQLYAIFDLGVQGFNAPVVAQNEVMVRRAIGDTFLAEGARSVLDRHVFVRYPQQYDLYLIGTFDTVTGAIAPVTPLVRVCSLSEFLSSPDL